MSTDKKISGLPEDLELTIYRELFNAMKQGFCLVQLHRGADGTPVDARCIDANSIFEALTGISSYKGLRVSEMFRDSDPSWPEFWAEIETRGEPNRFESYLAQSGRWLEVCACRLSEARTDSIILIFSDITDRKQKQQKQEALDKIAHERYHDLMAAQKLGRIGDFYFDLQNDIVHWSDELYRIMGFAAQEPMNFAKAISVYLPQDRKRLEWLASESLGMGKGFEMEAEFVPNGGSQVRQLFLKAQPVPDSSGKSVALKGIVQDITERKQAEVEIKQLNQRLLSQNRELESLNSELATFNNIAANDYSQTLRALYTNLEYVLQNDAQNLSNTGKANMRRAQTAIQKLKLLTEDIVAFSRIPAMDTRTDNVDLSQILSSVVSGLDAKIAEANFSIDRESLPSIHGFPLLVSILFHHLVDNALKFRSPNPRLQITHRETKRDGRRFHKICFSDNGIGFPPQERDNIFSIFYRLHDRQSYKGSGVGLAVCKKIMDLHGGFINASGREGQGAVFCCFFPS